MSHVSQCYQLMKRGFPHFIKLDNYVYQDSLLKFLKLEVHRNLVV